MRANEKFILQNVDKQQTKQEWMEKNETRAWKKSCFSFDCNQKSCRKAWTFYPIVLTLTLVPIHFSHRFDRHTTNNFHSKTTEKETHGLSEREPPTKENHNQCQQNWTNDRTGKKGKSLFAKHLSYICTNVLLTSWFLIQSENHLLCFCLAIAYVFCCILPHINYAKVVCIVRFVSLSLAYFSRPHSSFVCVRSSCVCSCLPVLDRETTISELCDYHFVHDVQFPKVFIITSVVPETSAFSVFNCLGVAKFNAWKSSSSDNIYHNKWQNEGVCVYE